MSTFSGLNTALSGLRASRTGLDVTGSNLANVNTAGYTRQRAELSAVGLPANGSLFTTGPKPGQGVDVTAISRLGDSFLDARVRTAFSSSGYTGVRADALSGIEKGMQEPGDTAVSGQLQQFWAAWGDVSNRPGDAGTTATLLQRAAALAQTIHNGYQGIADQWAQARSRADSFARDVNDTATQIAALNDQIRAAVAGGHPGSELIDQRDTLTAKVSQLTGGTVRELPDGGNEILLGGNVLVSGKDVNTVKVAGPAAMNDAGTVQLEWTKRPGAAIELDGGQLAGSLSILAGANAQKTGGVLAETAAEYDRLAQTLAAQVNAVHTQAYTADGTPGGNFFDVPAGPGAALGLSVKVGDAAGLATSSNPLAGKDGSAADKVAQLGTGPGSPDAQWAKTVVTTGIAVKTGLAQDVATGTALTNAVTAQQSNASVDIDEENVNLLAFQHAYQAAARVMSAIDESLDVLINQTGRVGR